MKCAFRFLSLIIALAMVMSVAACTGGTQNPTEPTEDAASTAPVFRMVVCSDTHVYPGSSTTTSLAQMCDSAYEYAGAHPEYNKIDAIAVVGDLTSYGYQFELRIFKLIMRTHMNENTELLCVMGNHELYEGNAEIFSDTLGEDLDRHVVVNGFHLIGLSTPDHPGTFSDSQVEWLSEQLAEAAADDPDKPIFTFQHQHIKDTVYVSRSWFAASSDALDAEYSKYPQVINFSGHSHGPINHPMSIWQDKYTLLGTGTLDYFEMEKGLTEGTLPADAGNAAQYYIVEVDAANRVTILPYNLLTGEFFKTPSNTDDPDKQLIYKIDNIKDPSTFEYTAARADSAPSPYFAEDARLTAANVTANSADIIIPTAFDDSCLYNYRMTLAGSDGSQTEYSFFASFYIEPMEQTHTFTVSELKAGVEYTVNVYPVNAWGKEGAPISLTFTAE